MFATIVAFGGAIYIARRAAAFREVEERASLRSDLAVRVLRRAAAASGGTTVTDDPLRGQKLPPPAQDLLSVIPGYLVVLNTAGWRVYQSKDVDSLTAADDIDALGDGIQRISAGARSVLLEFKGQPVLLASSQTDSVADFRVIAGTDATIVSAASLELLGAAFVVLPLILAISIGGAYVIAGRTVRPLESITTEVTAITDGRSLHRRLPLVAGNDELARLTLQLNSMIERLERSFAALRRFTADASHELKTPLAVLRADVEHAMHAQPNGDEQLEALEEALQETTRMADLVESLLTLARADEGRFDLHREPVTLEPLIRDVFETALILGEDAGLLVRMPVVQNAVVLGDRRRLRQLFLNLVTNALKYTPRGGEVDLTLARADGEAIFSVRDSGIGISAADLPHVFERFWRADRARSRVGERGGFGLGLAIGQWIAQAHGGSLTVESRLHRGSTFTVTLPVAPAESLAEQPSEMNEVRVAS
jgi:signal transduction histidine kinase